jgi:hypothetical protein
MMMPFCVRNLVSQEELYDKERESYLLRAERGKAWVL